MKLALRELRRQPGRFVAATAILFLLGSLLLLLSGLVEGLNDNNDGLIRRQSADLLVFSTTADQSIPQSFLPPGTAARIQAVPGVDSVGTLGLVQLGGRLPGSGPRDLIDVVVAGYDTPFAGLPAGMPTGSAFADASLRDRGVEVGTVIRVGAAKTPLEVTGFVEDAGFQTQPTLWVSSTELAAVVAANKADAALPSGASQALVVETATPAATAERIDAATDGLTETLTRAEAADAIPDTGGGVLQQIIGLTVLIAVAVVALFFALLTGERVGLYGVLKAVGARNRSIFAAVITQAVVLSAVAGTIAVVVAVLFEWALPADSIPFILTVSRVLTSVVLLLAASVVGASFSLRRVLRIDPASAIGTTT